MDQCPNCGSKEFRVTVEGDCYCACGHMWHGLPQSFQVVEYIYTVTTNKPLSDHDLQLIHNPHHYQRVLLLSRVIAGVALVLALLMAGVLQTKAQADIDCRVFDGIGVNVSDLWMATKDAQNPQYQEAMDFFGAPLHGYFAKLYGQWVLIARTSGIEPHVIIFAGWTWEDKAIYLGHGVCGTYWLDS